MTSDEETLVLGYLAAIQALCIQTEGLISGEGEACQHPASMLKRSPNMTMGPDKDAKLICECGATVSMSWDEYEEQIDAFGQE